MAARPCRFKSCFPHYFKPLQHNKLQRLLCFLNWETIRIAGKSEIIEIFLNFPVMDMNMNVLWHNSERVPKPQRERMTKFWGDDSWEKAAYSTTQGLFGEMQEKNTIDPVVEAFRDRLKKVAGFKYVPKPMPMRNSKGAVVYFLFFAAQQPTADKIVKEIFVKYAHRGEITNG